MLTRRAALRLAGLGALGLVAAELSAIVVSVANPARGAPASFPTLTRGDKWNEQWTSLVAAAEREGTLSLLTVAGDGYRAITQQFERTFPNIRVRHVIGGTIADWLGASRRTGSSGAADFDVGLIHTARALSEGRAEQRWAPIAPLLFRPDVLDDAVWLGGPASRFMDSGGDLCFAWEHQVIHAYAVNTDAVRPGSITSVPDLLEPAWRGKILSLDPRVGTAQLSAASVAKTWGMDTVGRLLVDQRPVLLPAATGTDVTTALASGQYPIALGVRPKALNPLRERGIGLNVSYLDLPDADFAATNLMFVFARTAHPAATALFANWMLTRETQTQLTAALRTNSARTDVPPSEPDGIATRGRFYYEPERESNAAHAAATERFISGLALRI
jgi:hypothetical protein